MAVLITRLYTMNINAKNPRTYFERWYADLWQRRIAAPNCAPSVFEPIFFEELGKIGARAPGYDPTSYRATIVFDNDRDYSLFVLKWA